MCEKPLAALEAASGNAECMDFYAPFNSHNLSKKTMLIHTGIVRVFTSSLCMPKMYRALSTAAVAVPIALIKAMRERTGAPMVECKSALAAEGNDVEKAVDWLRKKGVSIAGKKSGRTAAQGLIAVTVNEAGDVGSIVEVS